MIEVDSNVFLIKDPRVTALKSGNITVASFAYMIKPFDWFVLAQNTIYALTSTQYYALIPIDVQDTFTKEKFNELINLNFQQMSQTDRQSINLIKKAKDGCTSCQYKAYKNKFKALLMKYPAYRPLIVQNKQAIMQVPQYPQTTQTFQAKVTTIHAHLFQNLQYKRTPCFDCVQKHLGQAYVKGTQVQTGYPEHLVLCLANLQQAYEECPIECVELRKTILACIAQTKRYKKPFIPLKALLGILNKYRQTIKNQLASVPNTTSQDIVLQLSETMLQEINKIPITQRMTLAKLIQSIAKLLLQQNIDQEQTLRDIWAGKMVQLADQFLPFSKDIANMIRNRRLLFRHAPSLCKGTPYTGKDIYDALRKS